MTKPRNAKHKQLWLSPEADMYLKAGQKARNFRTERDYVERLILDDFYRLNESSTSPEFQPQTIKLDQIINQS
jgi:hypothetical protein